MIELGVIVFLVGIVLLVGYCAYRQLKPKDERFAIPVRDVDARKRAHELEKRLLAMEQEIVKKRDKENPDEEKRG